MDQVSTARLVIEGRYPEDEERVVNVVRTDFSLTNDDITRFLQAKFPNDYGWNRSMQRIVLVAINYEIIWESLDVAHDLSWLETTADALDYLKDTVLSTEKPVKAVGSVLLVDEHFIFIAVHLKGRLGKKVIIYDSMFMNVTFSGGIRRAGAKPVKEMREHLFEWENHPRFRADDETVLQIQSVTAKVHNFVENDVVREEEDESEDTETNEDDEANPTEDGQHNEEDDEENVQMSEDEGGKFLGQQMIDQRFDDVGASGMDMIAMDTEGQPPTPLSDVTTVLETQNDLHLKMPRHKNNSLLFLRDLMRYEVHALKDAEWKKTRISTTRTRTRDRQLENALECMEVGEEHIITKEASVSEDGIDKY
eukprot:augustus_masked-scaffold_30-processed-gene-3.13-mRNA-1 protein AED:1.00 eAED:1.00 QI:0/0/0/0/1/1/3/0/364